MATTIEAGDVAKEVGDNESLHDAILEAGRESGVKEGAVKVEQPSGDTETFDDLSNVPDDPSLVQSVQIVPDNRLG